MPTIRDLTPEEQEVISLIWDYLPKVKGDDERVSTVIGSKTKLGLVRTLRHMLTTNSNVD